MNILVAIQSHDNANKLMKTTLSWVARAGYTLKIFVADEAQRKKYTQMVADANYEWYLDLNESAVVVSITPTDYANNEGFDLILFLPDNISRWKKHENIDKTVLSFTEDVGSARSEFATDPNKNRVEFDNGAIIYRL